MNTESSQQAVQKLFFSGLLNHFLRNLRSWAHDEWKEDVGEFEAGIWCWEECRVGSCMKKYWISGYELRGVTWEFAIVGTKVGAGELIDGKFLSKVTYSIEHTAILHVRVAFTITCECKADGY